MSLIQNFETSGNRLFRYRGQVPYLLFIFVVPVVYFTDYSAFSEGWMIALQSLSVLVCLLGFGIRIYTIATAAPNTSGRNREEQVADSLNTTGIYSIVRHPLYLGNYLMWAGITMYVLNAWFLVVVSLLFWIYYERIMFAEERFLERKFPQAFGQWSARTPAFLPSFRNYVPSRHPFSCKDYSGLLAAVLSFVYVEILQESFTLKKIYIAEEVLVVVGVTLFLVLILRTISKRLRRGQLAWIR